MTLVLVCGPSGSGKDTVLNAVRSRLRELGRTKDVVFVCRDITRRPCDESVAVEVHKYVTMDEYRQMKYFLQWDAHSYSYGIPLTIMDDLQAGRHCIASVSRKVIDKAKSLYHKVVVCYIDSDIQHRLQRLHSRGRESEEEINTRLEREKDMWSERPDYDMLIMNDSSDLSKAVTDFMTLIPS